MPPIDAVNNSINIPNGLTVGLIIGWFVSNILGYLFGCYADRRRFLHGLRAQVAMIREDIELSTDAERRERTDPNAIENVWTRSLPEIRKTVFLALPHLIMPGEADRLRAYWVSLRDLRIGEFYQAQSLDENLDRNLYGIATVTQKQGILATLDRLEAHIR